MRTFATLLCVSLAATGVAPSQNQAIALTTGVDGGVDYAYDPLFLPSTGITVEAWLTYDDATVPTGLFYWPTVARQNITAQAESWNLRVSASNNNTRALQFIVRVSTNALYSATYNFAAGEFVLPTHIAGTFDGSVIRIFKNSVQVATYTIPGVLELRNQGGILRVGNGDPVAPGRESWNGTIDELRVWPMPRTGAEIAATINQELVAMPGGVLAFHMNGTYDEVDHNLTGTPFGTVGFLPSTTALAITTPFTLGVGQATTNCARAAGVALGAAPQIGNTGFAVWCVRAPVPQNAPLGIVVAAFNSAPISQPPFLGVQLAFDLTSVVAQVALVPATTLLGNVRFPLAIPNDPGLSGVAFLFQFGFYEPLCGPQGYTASNGLLFVIQ